MGSVTESLTTFVGVDAGKVHDPSAIVVADPAGIGIDTVYQVRHLQRLPLGTPYPMVAARVVEVCRNVLAILEARELEQHPRYAFLEAEAPWVHRVVLRVDGTGVGQAFVDILRPMIANAQLRVNLMPVVFTAGHQGLRMAEDGWWHVTKEYLVSRLQELIQMVRVKLPNTAETAALLTELKSYQVRQRKTVDTYGALQDGTYDDLVSALGLAVLRDQAAPIQMIAQRKSRPTLVSGRIGMLS